MRNIPKLCKSKIDFFYNFLISIDLIRDLTQKLNYLKRTNIIM